MSDQIVIKKTTVSVDTFFVPDTPENRMLVKHGEYDKLIYDNDGYYKNLVDSYGESELITHQLPD